MGRVVSAGLDRWAATGALILLAAAPVTAEPWTSWTIDAVVKALAVDGEILWIGTSNGLIRYDMQRDHQTTYTTKDGLLSNMILVVRVDSKHHLWVGTYGGGLSRFDGRQWLTFTPFGGGAAAAYGPAWARYGPGEGLGDLWVYDLAWDPQGRLWAATWKGVSVWDGTRWATYTPADGLVDKWVYALARDRQGVWWFGTEAGVSRFDGTHWQGFTHTEGLGGEVATQGPGRAYPPFAGLHHEQPGKKVVDYNPNYVVASAVDAAGHLWFGTWGGGVSRFDGSRWTTYTTREGLAGNVVHAVAVGPDGQIWFGTNGGVSRFNGKTFTTLTVKDGLLANAVYTVAVGGQGHKWFGTVGGVSRYTGP